MFDIGKVADVVVEMCGMVGKDIDTVWKHYIHELVKEGYNLEEVKAYIRKKQEQGENTKNNKISILNTIAVEDWGCDSGEVMYIHVLDNESNRKILTELGASETDLENMKMDTDGLLDISFFAFEYTDAEWWKHDIGFGKGILTE